MGRVTYYCVQSFRRAGPCRFASNALRQFPSERRAVAAGESAARRHAGAVVYRVSGNPEFDHWEAPRILGVFGEVPAPYAGQRYG